MLESIFHFLFKYRMVVWEKGQFAFAATWPMYVVLLAVGVVGILVAATYATARGKTRPRDRTVLTILRVAVLAVLVFCLLQPKLVLSTVVPQRNFLGILIDDSQSMQIPDGDGRARSLFVEESFGAEGGALLAALSERFILRFFRFSSSTERITGPAELTFTGTRTRLGGALEHARGELAGVPLSGLVVVTDGADNAESGLTEPLLALRASKVPVYTIGLGEERFAKDIEIVRATVPRSVLKGASVAVDLVVTQNGYRGSRVEVLVEDEGRVVGSKEVELPRDGEAAAVRVHVTATEPGPRLFRFRIPAQPGELVAENNQREALVVVEDRREKILYFEGEPRFELKFIRRAVAADENIQVTALQRTAESKFLRLDVDDAEELSGGFPKTREELFAYRGLILGSVEAGFFTPDQLRMIEDFVNQRGGGLLTLGGRLAFAEGGYAGTAVENVLPVVLEPGDADPGSRFFTEVEVELTPAGRSHAVTRIADGDEASAERWEELPPLSTFNPIGRVKAGATTLITGRRSDTGDSQVVLAYHRYGRGKTIAFTPQDSWIWQMHAEIPLEDMTHEMFWRQLLRWLVSDVPTQVGVTTSSDRMAPGDPIMVTAEVDDSTYLEVNDARVVARITDPTGAEHEVEMDWTVDRNGQYQAAYAPRQSGLHEVTVDATTAETYHSSNTAYVLAGDLPTEYFGAEMRSSVLKRIAAETGGRFYTPQTVSVLPEDISYTESGAAVLEEKDLWDMPAVFFAVVLLIAGEWGYRRSRGLA